MKPRRNIPDHYKPLPGSERKPLVEARHIGPVDPEESVEVSIYLKDPDPKPLVELMAQVKDPQDIPRLSREDYIKKHSAKEEDIESYKDFARDNSLSIVDVDRAARRIVLRGTAAATSHAFATELHEYEQQGKRFRGRTGLLHLPANLAEITESVLGTSNIEQVKPRIQRFIPEKSMFRPGAVPQSYTPPDLAKLYDFPQGLDGTGERIALIEPSQSPTTRGGYRQQDLNAYFQQLGIPTPTVTSISVDGAQNSPTGDPNSADGEIDLDIQVAGAIAPKAAIDVYFAPNTDKGFVDAIMAAIFNSRFPATVISISWGNPEDKWTQQGINTMNQAFAIAAALGITVFCAAGDRGSTDGEPDQKNHVDFPSSSPYITGCGGTRLESENGSVRETVWNDGPSSATGGGVSALFDLPLWQANVNVPLPPELGSTPKRGVPDVAANADPETGYKVRVDGIDLVFGGTSAVAPLWAGLIALINQYRKTQGKQSIGYLNPALYLQFDALRQANALRDVLVGNNGAFSAEPGWDACTGTGTPDGANFAKTFV